MIKALSLMIRLQLKKKARAVAGAGRLTAWMLGMLVSALPAAPAHAQAAVPGHACAMVVMHGKWGGPRFLEGFVQTMAPACDARSIDMPWSGRRAYDAAYPVALQEMAAQVQAFRAQGYRRVLLAGHSFGANAALAYMAEYGDADGVIALAPGHSPRYAYDSGIGRSAVDAARAALAAGKGDELLTMDDLNQGQRRSFKMPAQVLLSYFDPNGLGHMPGTAARFKRAVPLLWVIGTRDPLYAAGEGFAYARALPHPQSAYRVVQAGHKETPELAAAEVLAWVRQLGAP